VPHHTDVIAPLGSRSETSFKSRPDLWHRRIRCPASGWDREPRIERGFVRAEDWKAKASAGENAAPDGETGRTDQGKPLSKKLVAELTAYRTAGLRNALAGHPATALTAVVHALAAAAFYSGSDRISPTAANYFGRIEGAHCRGRARRRLG
jgi:hypothetical protein